MVKIIVKDDITGIKFGKLTAIKIDDSPKHKRTHWWCRCDCGSIRSVSISDLRNGHTKSCGCIKRSNLINRRFGKLLVVKFSNIKTYKNKSSQTQWLCKCDCGNEIVVSGNSLISGNTTSCGCYLQELRIKHNKSHDRLYAIYKSMLHRCYSPKSRSYRSHGKRGITVCKEWQITENYNGMNNFYEWALSNGYQDNLTIDRIDNNGNYEPSNCRWTTYVTQGNNRSNNHMITYNGETKTMAEWAREYNIPYNTFAWRINKSKWDIEKSLNTPVNSNKRKEIQNK